MSTSLKIVFSYDFEFNFEILIAKHSTYMLKYHNTDIKGKNCLKKKVFFVAKEKPVVLKKKPFFATPCQLLFEKSRFVRHNEKSGCPFQRHMLLP